MQVTSENSTYTPLAGCSLRISRMQKVPEFYLIGLLLKVVLV